MTDHLIERLRLSADRMATANCEMCHDAADALEASQARIAELEAALLGVLPYVSTSRESAERACMERQDSPIADAVSIARAALKPKP
jgi:hypothetical protein